MRMTCRYLLRPARIGALVTAFFLVGCATVERPAERGALPPAPTPSIKPLPGAAPAVDIAADCVWKDENGYNGQMRLLAARNNVQEFSAMVNHPRHGSCHFSLTDFRQTRETPNIELKGTGSPCTVRMWAQGRQVSVAFSSCESMCTGDAVDYLWPILADSTTGSCG